MLALGKLRKEISGKNRSKTGHKELCQSNRPKNGLLVLGVLMTVAVMVGLTIFNVKLMREQIATSKQSVEEPNTKSVVTVIPGQAPSSPKLEEKPHSETPEVTFYKQLKTEDGDTNSSEAKTQKPKSVEVGNSHNPVNSESAPQTASKAKEETDFSAPALSGKSCPSNPETSAPPSKSETSTNRYSVQVGVFSYPRIAQQWAEKWQSKGYPVVLRPIAKPKVGIQYRLLVGEFDSEKKADEFAKQLKGKEGITGLPLVIKN